MVVLDIILLLFSWLDSDLALVNIVVVVWLLSRFQSCSLSFVVNCITGVKVHSSSAGSSCFGYYILINNMSFFMVSVGSYRLCHLCCSSPSRCLWGQISCVSSTSHFYFLSFLGLFNLQFDS